MSALSVNNMPLLQGAGPAGSSALLPAGGLRGGHEVSFAAHLARQGWTAASGKSLAAGSTGALPAPLALFKRCLQEAGAEGKVTSQAWQPFLDKLLAASGYSPDQREAILTQSSKDGGINLASLFQAAASIKPQNLSTTLDGSAAKGAAGGQQDSKIASKIRSTTGSETSSETSSVAAHGVGAVPSGAALPGQLRDAVAGLTGQAQQKGRRAPRQAAAAAGTPVESFARLGRAAQAATPGEAGQAVTGVLSRAAGEQANQSASPKAEAAPAAAASVPAAPEQASKQGAGQERLEARRADFEDMIARAARNIAGQGSPSAASQAPALASTRALPEAILAGLRREASAQPSRITRVANNPARMSQAALDGAQGQGGLQQPTASPLGMAAELSAHPEVAAATVVDELVKGIETAPGQDEAPHRRESAVEGATTGPGAGAQFAESLNRAAAPSSPTPSAGAEVSPELARQVAHQVDRAIGLGVRRGEEHLRMRLQPPELGDLRMDLSLRGGDLKVVFIAETPAAREALKAAMPELRGSLAEQGLKLEQFSVFVRGEGAFSRGFADRDQSPDTGRGRASQATATEAVEAAAPATRSRAAGLVDVFC